HGRRDHGPPRRAAGARLRVAAHGAGKLQPRRRGRRKADLHSKAGVDDRSIGGIGASLSDDPPSGGGVGNSKPQGLIVATTKTKSNSNRKPKSKKKKKSDGAPGWVAPAAIGGGLLVLGMGLFSRRASAKDGTT